MLEKIKELTKDTAIYGISTILGRFLGFILTPFYTHVLPDQGEMGIYNNYYAAIAFLNVVFIYGMDAAFMKYASQNPEETKKKIFSTAMIAITASSVVFAAVLFSAQSLFINFLDIPSKYLFNSPERYYRFFYYLILILILDTITVIPFAYLRLERKSKKFALIRLVNILVNLLLNLLFFIKLKWGMESIFVANLLASLLSLVLLSPDILKNFKWVIDKEYLKKMLVFGVPYLPASLSAAIVQVINRPMVEKLTNYETLGVFSASYKLGTLMMLVVMMFQFAWQPFFLTNAKEKNAKEIFSKVLTLFLVFTSVLWILISLFIDELMKMKVFGISIYQESYQEGFVIVPIILLGYLFNGIYYNFQAGIYIEEKTKYFPIVTGAGAVVNVIVNLLLIPILGIIGAALGTLTAYMVMAYGLYYYSQKFYKIEYEISKIARLILLLFAACGVYYYLYFTSGLTIALKFLILIVFFGMMFLLRIVNKNEVVKLSKLLLRIK
ncbi:MAG: polysaccharide biosynthesis protein [Ignavibacteria bacterium]|nr:MAG: polysaccharide biosynthesis protein [Ignavibacteria bacterium]KAF0161216.1 MAG: polysaccharide biosynthesis protein [Ignavibacteria bacterium]